MIVVDHATGKVLRSHNPDVRHPPASLTKMMTLYLLFEALDRGKLKLNTRLRVSRNAARARPSKLYLRAGQRITVRHAILAIAVRSANDVARVVAEKLGRSETRFANQMTRKARRLGMRHTVFRNASGLPNRTQRTTARDMAILSRALLRNYPHYYHYFSTRYFSYGRRTYRNTNRLLGVYPGVDGIKTGYTRRARYNLASSAVRGKRRIVTVVLGANSSHRRFAQTRNLFDTAWRTKPTGPRRVLIARNRPKIQPPARQPQKLVASLPKASAPQLAKPKTQEPPAIVAPLPAAKPAPDSVARSGAPAAAAQPKTPAQPVQPGKPVVTVENLTPLPLGPGTRPTATQATATPQKNLASLPEGDRDYAVRIGVYKTEADAHAAAVMTAWALAKPYRDGSKVSVGTSWSGGTKRYTARIVQMTQRQATETCSLLSGQGSKCMAFLFREPVAVAAKTTVSQRVAKVSKTTRRVKKSTAKRRYARKSRPTRRRGRYAIQVGAHRHYRYARYSARKAIRKLPRKYRRGTRVRVARFGRGRMYRARLIGLTASQAQSACRVIKRRGGRCMAIRHRG